MKSFDDNNGDDAMINVQFLPQWLYVPLLLLPLDILLPLKWCDNYDDSCGDKDEKNNIMDNDNINNIIVTIIFLVNIITFFIIIIIIININSSRNIVIMNNCDMAITKQYINHTYGTIGEKQLKSYY